MDDAAFPDFDPSRIVYEGDGLLVVDKPAGVPSQSVDPDVPDDLPARLRRYFAARDLPTYLGIHQRLDTETSGLILYVRDRARNGAIGKQFESRHVEKTYVACVEKFPAKTNQTELRHQLVEEHGRMVPTSRGGKDAVTRVRVVERRGTRALLELSLLTGRTHQARAQLAAFGTPIAGDLLYGGPPAPRLLLHASALAVQSAIGRPLRFRAEVPGDFKDWLGRGDLGDRIYDDLRPLRSALVRAIDRRWGLLRAMPPERATTAFRLVHEEGDGLPGLGLDFYAGYVVANVYGELASHDARIDRLCDVLGELGFDGVYIKRRPKQANQLSESERSRLAPADPVRGRIAPAPLEIMEEGVPLLVRLGDGLATGFYPDQRANRRRVSAVAQGRTLLNLFSYTCAFSIAAARAGSGRTTNVDVSAAALERAQAGFAHASLDPKAHEFVVQDAHAFLERAVRKGDMWDLVILDPPSYGTSKGARFAIESDLEALVGLALRVMAPGGAMLASINHRGTSQARFRRSVLVAAEKAKRTVKVRDLPPPLDFPAETPHLKAVWVSSDKL